ncbi:MAG TPA: hypothetical protein VLA89_06740 [Gemmatimonadales bacterium]|nr:hypothetical protein [Gemmatimonadales bacterium]
MSTVLSGSLNTYSSSITSGTGYPGDADTGHGMRQFVSFVDELEPWNTKFLSKVKKGKAVWDSKLEAGVRVQMPHRVTLNEALDNSETGIDLASGHGARLHQYMVLYIPPDASGNAAEVVWIPSGGVTAGSDTITVVRAQGGTSAVAHDTALTIEVIGVALPDLTDYPIAPVIWGDLHYNYRQRFSKSVKVDKAEDIQHNWEDPDGNVFERKLAKTAKQAKLEFEKALLLGRRQVGAPSTPTPSLLSGVDHFCELSGNSDDLNGAILNIYDLEAAIRDRREEVDANYGDTAIFNYTTQAMLDTAFNLKRQATMSDTSANLQLQSVTFGAGSLQFLPLPTNRFPETKIDIVRFDDLAYYPYQQLDWSFFRKEMGVDTDGSYEIGSISADFTFLPEALDPMFQIIDFEDDITLYPRDLNN